MVDEPDTISAAEQAEVDAAWAEEIERRSEALEAGQAELRPADEVMKELRERLLRCGGHGPA